MGKVLDDRTNGQGPKMTKINRKCDSRLDGFGFNMSPANIFWKCSHSSSDFWFCVQNQERREHHPLALLLLLALLASSLFPNDFSKVVFGELSDVETVVVSWLLTAAVFVTEFQWSNSTVQISKDISPLYAASFCVIYLFTLGWFVLTRLEGNCGNPLLGMVGGFSIPAWFAAASWYQNSTTFDLATNFAGCGLLVFPSSLQRGALKCK